MLPAEELREALLSLPILPQMGIWSRVVEYHLLQGPPPGSKGKPQPLWPGGSVLKGGRFTPKRGFGSIYLASDPVTALSEVAAVLTGIGSVRTPPWVVVTVEGFLEGVLDLTKSMVQSRLGTSIAELTGDWRFSQSLHSKGQAPMPPTQLLGKTAYETGRIVGMRYHSTRNLGKGARKNELDKSRRIRYASVPWSCPTMTGAARTVLSEGGCGCWGR